MQKFIESIKNYIYSLKVKSGFLMRYLIKKNFRRTSLYTSYLNELKVEDNLIFYESSNSKSINGNPYALFKYLIDNPDYKDYIHVWSARNLNDNVIKKFSSDKNVKFILYNSKDYLKYLSSAKYLINDSTFPYYFIKRDEQIYVNIWHGTPLKYMGKDVKAAIGDHKNVQRNFLHTSYLINSNKYTSDILLKSHDIHTMYNGCIANIGYPSVDLIHNTDKKALKKLLKIKDEEKIVLYAPTWRGKSPFDVDDHIKEVFEDIDKINNNLPPNYRLFIKLHTYTNKFQNQELKELAIPDYLEINEMLSITDILITDYSSVFFEFLSTKKPILFFCYDKDEYMNNRGLYIPLEELPGPICETPEEIIKSIKNIDLLHDRYAVPYSDYINKFACYDDGNASKRVADLIFNNKSFPRNQVYKITDKRKKHLFYSGLLLNNESTDEFIDLVNFLESHNYDVYVFVDSFSKIEIKTNILKFSKDVKILYKVGGFSFTLNNYYLHNRLLNKGSNNEIEKNIPRELYVNESRRLFGSTDFETVLDFRGEKVEPAALFAFGKFKRKYIYLNPINEDNLSSHEIQLSKKDLSTNMTLYKFFDLILFKPTNEGLIDKRIMGEFPGFKTKLKPLKNPLDYINILESTDNDIQIFGDKKYHCEKYEISDKEIEISCNATIDKSYINFIFVGKLVYNKGFLKMIDAFYKVNHNYENIRLYIVGEGPLESSLKNKVFNLGLEEKIIFITSLTKISWILNKCDCILLPFLTDIEDYSLNEVLDIKKPRVSIEPYSRGILDESSDIIVENSVNGLKKGMIKFIEKSGKKIISTLEVYEEA